MTSLTDVPMMTARYRLVHELLKRGVELPFWPVRTSIGVPRFISGASGWPSIGLLAPYGIKGIEDRGEFEKRYRARLDRYGAAKIHGVLAGIFEQQGPISWLPGAETGERKPLGLL